MQYTQYVHLRYIQLDIQQYICADAVQSIAVPKLFETCHRETQNFAPEWEPRGICSRKMPVHVA